MIQAHDDDLARFAAEGAPALPKGAEQGHVEHEGARIWYATYGSGVPVVMLHGGLGHSGNWGYQVPAVIKAGYRAVLVDSRGHGRSTRDERPLSYDLMASDVLAVMDAVEAKKPAIVGWSDGACTALILARHAPKRVSGVFFFACNMDPSGTKKFRPTPVIDRCFTRHAKDYATLSATPHAFTDLVDTVTRMQQTEPNYTKHDLAQIQVPVTIAHSEHDEFIKRDHAEHLATTIPHANLTILPAVTHFAPLQRPNTFNEPMLTFIQKSTPT